MVASSPQFANILTSQFSAPISHSQLELVRFLKSVHPNSQHVSTLQHSDGGFPLSGYLKTLNITPVVNEDESHKLVQYGFADNDKHSKIVTYSQVIAGVSNFTYESTDILVYKVTWWKDHITYVFYHFVFDGTDDSVGQKLTEAVYVWANSLKEEMWVYDGGCWTKDKELYKSVKASKWDDIVLREAFMEGLRRDTETFFSSRDTYHSLGITWKRGLLLLGPPGNGKTESIKALLNEFDYPALYVKTFVTRMGPEEGVRAIFQHARKHAPCILILEDLDAMVTGQVRSFFLNELDGIANNEGILTIATTNHPERIDDAILNRPSRFDVKYDFALPELDLRKEFAEKWIGKIIALGPDTGIAFEKNEEVVNSVAEKTEGWSYAFLKELFVSFLLRVAHDKSTKQKGGNVSTESSDILLLNQVDQLASQILTINKEPVGQPEQPGAGALQRTMIVRQQAASTFAPTSGTHF